MGFALRQDGSIEWVSIGLKCVTCGQPGVHADWKIVLPGSAALGTGLALRRVMTLDDRGALSALAKQSKAADYRLQAIVENLVLSDMFQKR